MTSGLQYSIHDICDRLEYYSYNLLHYEDFNDNTTLPYFALNMISSAFFCVLSLLSYDLTALPQMSTMLNQNST